MNVTWLALSESTTVTEIAKMVIAHHEQINKRNEILKSLESKKLAAQKASSNLISAIEQGIITEQTKTRLKELEAEISQLDFDIEQEHQRTYTTLTVEKVENYLHSVIRGDIEAIAVRKSIVKAFIREILLYSDKLVITYNFTEQPPSKDKNLDIIQDIEKQEKNPAFSMNLGSNILENFPPRVNCPNPRLNGFGLFLMYECFGVCKATINNIPQYKSSQHLCCEFIPYCSLPYLGKVSQP
jgi:hypothetical protein